MTQLSEEALANLAKMQPKKLRMYLDHVCKENIELTAYIGQLRKRIARLEQIAADRNKAGHAAAQPKWLPIETAPKGTEVLICPTKNMGICVAMNDSRDGWVTETQTEWVSIYTPTHYMPLPAPPEQKE